MKHILKKSLILLVCLTMLVAAFAIGVSADEKKYVGVASIQMGESGTAYYDSLYEAICAAGKGTTGMQLGTEITLLEDIVLTDSEIGLCKEPLLVINKTYANDDGEVFEIADGIVVNLNGKTISVADDKTNLKNKNAITVNSGKTITFENGYIKVGYSNDDTKYATAFNAVGEGTVVNANNVIVDYSDYVYETIEYSRNNAYSAVAYKASNKAVINVNKDDALINDAATRNTITFASVDEKKAANDGVFVSTAYFAYAKAGGTVNVYEGTFYGDIRKDEGDTESKVNIYNGIYTDIDVDKTAKLGDGEQLYYAVVFEEDGTVYTFNSLNRALEYVYNNPDGSNKIFVNRDDTDADRKDLRDAKFNGVTSVLPVCEIDFRGCEYTIENGGWSYAAAGSGKNLVLKNGTINAGDIVAAGPYASDIPLIHCAGKSGIDISDVTINAKSRYALSSVKSLIKVNGDSVINGDIYATEKGEITLDGKTDFNGKLYAGSDIEGVVVTIEKDVTVDDGFVNVLYNEYDEDDTDTYHYNDTVRISKENPLAAKQALIAQVGGADEYYFELKDDGYYYLDRIFVKTTTADGTFVKYYNTLQDAVQSDNEKWTSMEDGETVVLLKNIVNEYVKFEGKGEYTLDLNEMYINAPGAETDLFSVALPDTAVDGDELEWTITGDGVINSEYANTVFYVVASTLNLNGVEVNADSDSMFAFICGSDVKLNINDADIDVKGEKTAVFAGSDTAELLLGEDATVVTEKGIIAAGFGTTTVNGSTLETGDDYLFDNNYANVMDPVKVYLNGGDFTAAKAVFFHDGSNVNYIIDGNGDFTLDTENGLFMDVDGSIAEYVTTVKLATGANDKVTFPYNAAFRSYCWIDESGATNGFGTLADAVCHTDAVALANNVTDGANYYYTIAEAIATANYNQLVVTVDYSKGNHVNATLTDTLAVEGAVYSNTYSKDVILDLNGNKIFFNFDESDKKDAFKVNNAKFVLKNGVVDVRNALTFINNSKAANIGIYEISAEGRIVCDVDSTGRTELELVNYYTSFDAKDEILKLNGNVDATITSSIIINTNKDGKVANVSDRATLTVNGTSDWRMVNTLAVKNNQYPAVVKAKETINVKLGDEFILDDAGVYRDINSAYTLLRSKGVVINNEDAEVNINGGCLISDNDNPITVYSSFKPVDGNKVPAKLRINGVAEKEILIKSLANKAVIDVDYDAKALTDKNYSDAPFAPGFFDIHSNYTINETSYGEDPTFTLTNGLYWRFVENGANDYWEVTTLAVTVDRFGNKTYRQNWLDQWGNNSVFYPASPFDSSLVTNAKVILLCDDVIDYVANVSEETERYVIDHDVVLDLNHYSIRYNDNDRTNTALFTVRSNAKFEITSRISGAEDGNIFVTNIDIQSIEDFGRSSRRMLYMNDDEIQNNKLGYYTANAKSAEEANTIVNVKNGGKLDINGVTLGGYNLYTLIDEASTGYVSVKDSRLAIYQIDVARDRTSYIRVTDGTSGNVYFEDVDLGGAVVLFNIFPMPMRFARVLFINTTTYEMTSAVAIAETDGKFYISINEALANTKGKKVTLIADIVAGADDKMIWIDSGKTIDLAGYSLTGLTFFGGTGDVIDSCRVDDDELVRGTVSAVNYMLAGNGSYFPVYAGSKGYMFFDLEAYEKLDEETNKITFKANSEDADEITAFAETVKDNSFENIEFVVEVKFNNSTVNLNVDAASYINAITSAEDSAEAANKAIAFTIKNAPEGARARIKLVSKNGDTEIASIASSYYVADADGNWSKAN